MEDQQRFSCAKQRQALMLLWQRIVLTKIHVQKLDWMVLAICLGLVWPVRIGRALSQSDREKVFPVRAK